MRVLTAATALLVFSPTLTLAEGDVRGLGAHEHGSGALNIAVEDNQIAMEFEAPGADIVGFEYAATSEADREAIDTAVSDLARPLTLFVLPSAAGCNVVEANVALLGDEDHEEHDHDEHAHDDHDDHEDHAEDEHEEHGDEDHAKHDHDAHDHDDHEDEQASGEHTEFHAEYKLDCTDPQAIDKIEFVYFERFPNALELDVQLVTDAGANAFEVERTSPVLDLRGMF